MRPVQPSDDRFVKEQMQRLVEDDLLPMMQATHPEASIMTETIGEVEGLDPNGPEAARALLADLLGDDQASTVPFGTEAGLFQGLGLSAVVCGPGSIEQAHKPDEYVSVDQLGACLALLEKLGRRLAAP